MRKMFFFLKLHLISKYVPIRSVDGTNLENVIFDGENIETVIL